MWCALGFGALRGGRLADHLHQRVTRLGEPAQAPLGSALDRPRSAPSSLGWSSPKLAPPIGLLTLVSRPTSANPLPQTNIDTPFSSSARVTSTLSGPTLVGQGQQTSYGNRLRSTRSLLLSTCSSRFLFEQLSQPTHEQPVSTTLFVLCPRIVRPTTLSQTRQCGW